MNLLCPLLMQCAFGHIRWLVLLELTRHLVCIVIQRGACRGVATWSKTKPAALSAQHYSTHTYSFIQVGCCFCHWQSTLFTQIRTWNSSGQWKMCTWKEFLLLSLTADVLACCHIWALHWGREAASASVSQCIGLLTPPPIHMYLAPTMLKLQRHCRGEFIYY